MISQKQIFEHFKKMDPKIYKVMKDMDFKEFFEKHKTTESEDNYYHKLCKSIIGQQLSGKAARTIYGRFVDLIDTEDIQPKDVLKVADQKLRDAGLSWAKVSYLKDLALKVDTGELDLAHLTDLPEEEVLEQLVNVKGIGPWTAEMFLMFTLNREDVFSHGDLGLKKGIEKVYGIENPTKKQREEIVSKWSPYKTYGSVALWHSLDNM